MEMRHNIQMAMEQVESRFIQVEEEFFSIFGRKYGRIDAIECDDADIVLIMAGTAASTCRQVIADLRSRGEKVGSIKLKMFRPFPKSSIRQVGTCWKKWLWLIGISHSGQAEFLLRRLGPCCAIMISIQKYSVILQDLADGCYS